MVRRWSPELSRALTATGATAIHIRHGWPEPGLDLLVPHADQLERVIVELDLSDLSALEHLPKLSHLSIRGGAETLDFSRCPRLETMRIWSDKPGIGNLHACAALNKLSIGNCGLTDFGPLAGLGQVLDLEVVEAPFRSLEGITELAALERLSLSQAPAESLAGIEHAPGLRSVGLFGLGRLTSIAPLLRLRRLRLLEIEASARIGDVHRLGEIAGLEGLRLAGLTLTDVTFLSRLPALRSLTLGNVGNIPSLAFLRSLTALEGLGLLGSTVIVDGDLSPLLGLPALSRVQYTERRHYQPRKREIQGALRSNAQS